MKSEHDKREKLKREAIWSQETTGSRLSEITEGEGLVWDTGVRGPGRRECRRQVRGPDIRSPSTA